MPALPLAGPSYELRALNAACERVINWMPVLIESGNGRQRAYLKQVDGLLALGSATGKPARGCWVTRERLFVVMGNTLYEVSSSWAYTARATLYTSAGRVGMAANNTQLAVVDGANLYVLDLDTNAVTTNPANYVGSALIDMLDGYGIAGELETAQFFLSGNQDFTIWDALDYASAEAAAGPIKGHIVKNQELFLFKTETAEPWYDAGGADFAFARRDGAGIEVGLAATHTLQKVGGVAYFLGQDAKGSRIVFAMQGFSPVRISTHALEEKLSAVADVSDAYAYTYHREGLTFYVLQVPGLETTWVYEVASGLWFERSDFEAGEHVRWRAECIAFAFGKHVAFDADGQAYELTHTVKANGSGPLVRDRITPSMALPTREKQRFSSVEVDCDMGEGLASGQAAQLMLRYSDDGGHTWSNWRYLSLGVVGQYSARARASMLGSSRERVWHIRVTDAVTCNPVALLVNER